MRNSVQRKVHALILRSKDGYWKPERVMRKIMEECRELVREVNRRSKREVAIEEEAGDLLFAIACLLNPRGINFDSAVEKSIKKFSRRDTHLYQRKSL